MLKMELLFSDILVAVSLCFILACTKFLEKYWWIPVSIQHQMRLQGIGGPPYKFIHGNTKEISKMRESSMAKTMDLSHNIFPRIQPHLYSWINIYGDRYYHLNIRHGRNFLHWQGHKAELIITETELIKEMLNTRDGSFSKSENDKYIKKITGDGIVATEGEKWVKLRKVANHAFHAENLKNMIPAMVESTEMMLRKWRSYEGKEIEVCEEFRLLGSEIISRTAFGSSYMEGQHIFEMLRKLTFICGRNRGKIRLPIISQYVKTKDDRESDQLEKRIRDYIIEIVEEREKLKTGENTAAIDFLALLLEAHRDADENNKISIEEIIDECKIFYSAGQGTTTILLTWTILLLAKHKNWQDRAREEVIEVIGNQPPNSEGISRLKVMSMIINESLRLYPPLEATKRKAKKGARLGNIIFPDEIDIKIPFIAVHHDPNLWGEDVHLFKPERFSQGVAKATKNDLAAFLPFSLGPRTCVGLNFAITEAKITLSMILQHFTFTLATNYVHSPVQIMTLHPLHGIPVMLHAL